MAAKGNGEDRRDDIPHVSAEEAGAEALVDRITEQYGLERVWLGRFSGELAELPEDGDEIIYQFSSGLEEKEENGEVRLVAVVDVGIYRGDGSGRDQPEDEGPPGEYLGGFNLECESLAKPPAEIFGDEKKRALLRWAMAVYLESLAVDVVGDLLEGMGFGAEVERLGIDEQAVPEGFEELFHGDDGEGEGEDD